MASSGASRRFYRSPEARLFVLPDFCRQPIHYLHVHRAAEGRANQIARRRGQLVVPVGRRQSEHLPSSPPPYITSQALAIPIAVVLVLFVVIRSARSSSEQTTLRTPPLFHPSLLPHITPQAPTTPIAVVLVLFVVNRSAHSSSEQLTIRPPQALRSRLQRCVSSPVN
ncbi:hypothetical protein BaRGS_00036074 [Batillaria attramentaria]|uniref:Uncharacterized protein n=1 Tax=Batillaria attramentaria TaxID=370345 RepID=A0ABD0JDP3_9CAEN